VGQACIQVKAYITDKDINRADDPAFIMVLEMQFGDPHFMATAEGKLGMPKEINSDFSTYYAEF
jgi:hypothetical protein